MVKRFEQDGTVGRVTAAREAKEAAKLAKLRLEIATTVRTSK